MLVFQSVIFFWLEFELSYDKRVNKKKKRQLLSLDQ